MIFEYFSIWKPKSDCTWFLIFLSLIFLTVCGGAFFGVYFGIFNKYLEYEF